MSLWQKNTANSKSQIPVYCSQVNFMLQSIKMICSNLVEQPILIFYSMESTWERDTEVCDLELTGFFAEVTSLFWTSKIPFVCHNDIPSRSIIYLSQNIKCNVG